MKQNVLNKFNFVARSLVLIALVLLIQTGSNVDELKVENDNLNKTLDLTAMSKKVQEDIYNDLYSAKDTYIGELTGYAADCPLCSGKLACMPSLDVLNGNDSYVDSLYGKVRIVASSSNLPCGTVLKFDTNRVESNTVTAIVLDRGVLGKDLDLLVTDQSIAINKIGRSSITYDILRFGWER